MAFRRWDGRMNAARYTEAANMHVLFPELAAAGAPRFCLQDTAKDNLARVSRRTGEIRVLAPALLHTPHFHQRVPWISGTVATIWRGGTAKPGWVQEALDHPPSDGTAVEAQQLAARMVREQTGGTFWVSPPDPALLRAGCVLVEAPPDHTRTVRMLQTAVDQGDAAGVILLLPRPDQVMVERARRLGCTVLSGAWDPWPLLAAAKTLHAVTGDEELAILARLAGIQVVCQTPGHTQRHHTTDVAAAFLVQGTRYADPFTGRPIDCTAALDIAAEWRRVTCANRTIGAMTGMSFWKRRRMATFFHTGERAPPHRRTAAAALRAANGRAVAVWSSRMPSGLGEAGLLRVEDGFVRSFGLGSSFLPPCSVIADATGIYYDPSRPNDLETLLRETRFEPAILARTRRLMDRLVREGVTKYGAGVATVDLPAKDGRRRLLVPGQVADDLSVRLGGAGCVSNNEDLLARVRAANPDAMVIYKPHPDVAAGHRPGTISETVMRRHANLVVHDVPMAALIAAVDEIHTMTSLAGYEALLRGRRVVVYARPFYAGWGLTEDLVPLPRRDRRLTLEELSAGILLLYPRYLDPVTELPCAPEVLLDRLGNPAVWRESGLMRLRRLQGQLRVRLAR
jgi:capsular polysaccharide export protein